MRPVNAIGFQFLKGAWWWLSKVEFGGRLLNTQHAVRVRSAWGSNQLCPSKFPGGPV